MQVLVESLVSHGYTIFFCWVLGAQAGLPLPAIPLLLAGGALAGAGKLDLAALLALSLVASLLSDLAWFLIGRRHGARVLGFLCRISLEPDSCVRRTQEAFAARGARTLVLAKFVPGLSTAAPPLAGMTGMPLARFLWLDGLGALVWTAAFVVPGYLFSDALERLAEQAALTGAWLLGIFATIVVAWIVVRFTQRQRFLRRLRAARIAPADLHLLLQADAAPFVVDLRHAADFAADPRTVPGALRLTPEQIEARHVEIPRDRDVVLYCT
jgi:membrane protein DedA with SNARE-associated domain